MNGEVERRVKSVFASALEVDATDREAFVAARCGEDRGLARRVRRLLAAHEAAGSFLAERPGEPAAPPASALDAGHTLSAYRLVARLGVGGMGTVYLAELVRPALGLAAGERVALKVIHPHLLEVEGFFKRFLREARVGQTVAQPNVVRTLDCDAVSTGGRQHHFLVMELVEGQTVREVLAETPSLPEELCRHIGREVARGLAAIHRAGAVHRDIKPENVMLTCDHAVKIMDLGVARLRNEALPISTAGGFVGSLEYAAPEQLDGRDRDVDGRADLYTLGVLLYELATGQHPHRRDETRGVLRSVLEGTPRRAGDVNPQLSPFLEELIHTLIARDPAERPDAADELAAILDEGEASAWWEARSKGLRVEARGPLRRIRIPRETALCGRADEMAQLDALLGAARDGRGQVVLVEGEAGIGKTRLIDEFVTRAQRGSEDVALLFASFVPGVAATSTAAFGSCFAEFFGPEGAAGYLAKTPRLVPAFDATLRGEPPPDGEAALAGDTLATCYVNAMRAIAARRTTIVLVDDLHFAPAEARSLFAQLASAVPGHRILLVGTLRPGVPHEWLAQVARLDHVTRMALGRLGAKDLADLLVEAFRSERLAEELGFRIAHKSDGNPFFAFEIIRGLREGGLIGRRPDGTWMRTSVIREIEVPSSVADLIEARLQGLDPAERELLDVAACVGFGFDPELVAEVLDAGVMPTLRSFGRIEQRHRLVRSAGRDLVFDHHQVQETLYAGLLPRLRARYHAAIGRTLLGGRDAPTGGLAARVCTHLLRGGEGQRARPHLAGALDHLRRAYRNEDAAALAQAALDAPDLLTGRERLDVLLSRVTALDLSGLREEEEAAIEEARRIAADLDSEARLRVERAAGELSARTGRFGEAEARFAACLELARELDDRKAEAGTTGSLGAVTLYQGRYAEAEALFERHLAMARETGDPAGETRARINLANARIRLGQQDAAREELRAVLAEGGDTVTQHVEAHVLINIALSYSMAGRYAEMLDPIRRCLEVSRGIGYRRGEIVATSRLANALSGLGRREEAETQTEHWLRLAEESGDLAAVAYARGSLAQLHIARGHFGEAQAEIDRHLALAREMGDRPSEVRAVENLVTIQLAQGRHDEAAARLAWLLDATGEIGDRGEEAAALSLLGDLAAARGDPAEAEAFHERALATRRELGDANATTPQLALARLALDRGDAASAEARLAACVSVAREQDQTDVLLLALTLRVRATGGSGREVLDTLGRVQGRAVHATLMEVRFGLFGLTGDAAHLDEARRLLDVALAHTAPDLRPTMIRAVPLHAAIAAAGEADPPSS